MKKHRTNWSTGMFIVVVILNVAILGLFGNMSYQIAKERGKIQYNYIGEYDYTCNKTNLDDLSRCWVSYVSRFYDYNLSNIDNSLTFKQLKEQGGVCWHYARLYVDMAQDAGYYAKEVIMNLKDTSSHSVALVSNEEGYCVLDQLNRMCYMGFKK